MLCSALEANAKHYLIWIPTIPISILLARLEIRPSQNSCEKQSICIPFYHDGPAESTVSKSPLPPSAIAATSSLGLDDMNSKLFILIS